MVSGLSPLARGNPGVLTVNAPFTGPIPARAGEPNADSIFCAMIGAYPRSRGGTAMNTAATGSPKGLSPLARGNPALSGFFYA